MEANPVVEHFRQIVIWPLQLEPLARGSRILNHSDLLTDSATRGPWREVADEFTDDPAQFSERHYFEFVSFLPFVRRFLYGEGLTPSGRAPSELEAQRGIAAFDREASIAVSPIRSFRRSDVTSARIKLRAASEPLVFHVAHVDLYFFFDTEIAILAVEIFADDLPLNLAIETLDGFRRAYPTNWERSGHASRCPESVEWCDAAGAVIGASDYEDRAAYLAFACEHRAPSAASHWNRLLEPIVPFHGPFHPGHVRYRQIEDDRIPSMVYIACDDPGLLHRADFVRMAFGTRRGEGANLPYSLNFLKDFESRYCYDRYWDQTAEGKWSGGRYLCTGAMFTVVGSSRDNYFAESGTGVLGQFRHQFFLLGLIVHFHKAVLLTMADRLSQAVNRLDPSDALSVRVFQREVRRELETFLRFDNRYWFHEVSNQLKTSDLYRMWSEHLGNTSLYHDVRQKSHDINAYLDSTRTKRMADMGVRLGVVATFGFIGAIVTSFMGMNVIAATENPLWVKVVIVLLVFIPTTLLTLYTVSISRRLADFLDTIANDRLSWKTKALAALDIWRRNPR